MEKIADTFDRNRSGLIDLSEIMAILMGQKARSKPGLDRQLSDAEKIDNEVSYNKIMTMILSWLQSD